MSETPQEELQLRSAGQRRVNIIWESTQAIIALSVVLSFLYACVKIALNSDIDKTAFIVLSDIVSLVIGFYFGRTNHTRQGGVGTQWEGR